MNKFVGQMPTEFQVEHLLKQEKKGHICFLSPTLHFTYINDLIQMKLHCTYYSNKLWLKKLMIHHLHFGSSLKTKLFLYRNHLVSAIIKSDLFWGPSQRCWKTGNHGSSTLPWVQLSKNGFWGKTIPSSLLYPPPILLGSQWAEEQKSQSRKWGLTAES